jgi:putative membrane protein
MYALAPSLTVLGQMPGNGMDGWAHDGPPWWGIVCMSILGIAVLAAIIWGAITLSRQSRPQPPATPSGPNPIDTLNQRYARGELDTADYEERKRQLT